LRTSVFCSTFAASYLLQTIMANILKSFFSQCARPEGALGRVMLSFMNYTHAPLTKWGLRLVDVKDGWTMLDVGCGGGFTIRRLLKRSQDVQVYGIDISEESVAKAKKVNAEMLDKQVFICQGSAEKLPYEDGKFDLVTAVETVYFWPNLPNCLQEVRRVLKSGGKFAILVEVVDSDSKWTNVVEGMTAYSPEDLKKLLDEAGLTQTEIHRKKPTYATILGVKP
jgi:ubiquinone/menaquinone biosynthesis C-methylase UbiE